MEHSDEALIKAHRRGDPAAFGELVRRYADPLLGYLRRRSVNRQQAEDCFQETFLKVHRKAATFRSRGRFKSWLYSIATNVAIDGLRKAGREPQMISLNKYDDCGESDVLESTMAVEEEKSSDPFEAAVLAEQKVQVQQAIEQLPERQQAALILAYYQGLTYREVAETLGCSVGTVKTQVFRALKKLAGLLPNMQGGIK